MTTQCAEDRWKKYYQFVAQRYPRELLISSMKRYGDRGTFGGMAVDFGCGPGIETFELLRKGWQVLATDVTPEALDLVQKGVPEDARSRLETQVASFESVELPQADLIWAGVSLPFCPRGHISQVLENICKALKPGGRFVGDFFAPNHEWAPEDHVTTMQEAEIKDAFSELELEYWMEHEGERITTHGPTHWHAYGVVFKKD